MTPATVRETSNSMLGTSREGTSTEVTHLPLKTRFDVDLTDGPGRGTSRWALRVRGPATHPEMTWPHLDMVDLSVMAGGGAILGAAVCNRFD